MQLDHDKCEQSGWKYGRAFLDIIDSLNGQITFNEIKDNQPLYPPALFYKYQIQSKVMMLCNRFIPVQTLRFAAKMAERKRVLKHIYSIYTKPPVLRQKRKYATAMGYENDYHV